MDRIIIFLISLIATIVGSMSGIGGGVIIRPVLDVATNLDPATAGFLSGCTVLAMAAVSLLKSKGSGIKLELKTTLPIAAGASIGGILGKIAFTKVMDITGSDAVTNLIQSILMIVTMISILVYFIIERRIETKNVEKNYQCFLIGAFLGIIGSFLGIGGGPLNIIVLSFAFSMETKTRALNSIFIILCSQLASILFTIITGTIPAFDIITLVIMIGAAILGGTIGSNLLKTVEAKSINRIFYGVIIFIIFVSAYNIKTIVLI